VAIDLELLSELIVEQCSESDCADSLGFLLTRRAGNPLGSRHFIWHVFALSSVVVIRFGLLKALYSTIIDLTP